jgi:hypothetical protein
MFMSLQSEEEREKDKEKDKGRILENSARTLRVSALCG